MTDDSGVTSGDSHVSEAIEWKGFIDQARICADSVLFVIGGFRTAPVVSEVEGGVIGELGSWSA